MSRAATAMVLRGLTVLCALAAGSARAAPAALGDVAFATSCAAAAQAPFLRGLALLHDFEYGDAAASFRAAETADPRCAIAYWGEAMTFNHPLWREQDAAAGRAVLARLGDARAGSAREAAYLHAVRTLYGTGSKIERDDRYAEEMLALHEAYPGDVDATAFAALALLGTAHGGRDTATYMKAAALLEAVFPSHPRHPGVLHYMIHAYDDPAHAPLGMRAARLYGAIAAGAPHAVHMTSHIFIALGMWGEVIAANDAAIRAVDAKVPAGQTGYVCGHYPEWLVYGLLQERRFGEAAAAIGRCRAQAAAAVVAHRPQPAFPGAAGRAVLSYADMLVRQAVETGQWNASAMPALDDGAFVEARFGTAYAEAMTAADPRPANGRLHAAFDALQKHFSADTEAAQDVQFWRVMVQEADALGLKAAGRLPAAIDSARAAAQHETAIPIEFGPPAVPKPPFELLGDLLLAAHDPGGAAEAYRAALVRAPGRTLSLRGLATAAAKLGDTRRAAEAKAELALYVR